MKKKPSGVRNKGRLQERLQKIFEREGFQNLQRTARKVTGNERREELTDDRVKDRLSEYFRQTSMAKSKTGKWLTHKGKPISQLQKEFAMDLAKNEKFVNELFSNKNKAQRFVDTFTYNQNETSAIQENVIHMFRNTVLDTKREEYYNMNWYATQKGYQILWNACSENEQADLGKNDTLVRAREYEAFMDKNPKSLATEMVAINACQSFIDKIHNRLKKQVVQDLVNSSDNVLIEEIVKNYDDEKLSIEDFISQVRAAGYGKELFEAWEEIGELLRVDLKKRTYPNPFGDHSEKIIMQDPEEAKKDEFINLLKNNLTENGGEDVIQNFTKMFKNMKETNPKGFVILADKITKKTGLSVEDFLKALLQDKKTQ